MLNYEYLILNEKNPKLYSLSNKDLLRNFVDILSKKGTCVKDKCKKQKHDIFLKNDLLDIKITKNILKQQKNIILQDNLIAELSFGFWVKLLTKTYSLYLRYNDLKQIFPNLQSSKEKKIKRHFIFTQLNKIRLFRSKVFHHDKTISKAEYQNMMNLIYEFLAYFDDEIVKITKELNNE